SDLLNDLRGLYVLDFCGAPTVSDISTSTNEKELLERGKQFCQSGQFEQALSAFSRAVQLSPLNPAGYIERGNAHYLRGEKAKAVDDWDKALCLNASDIELRMTRASALLELNRLQECLSEIASVLLADPHYSPAYNLRGLVFQRQRKNSH